MLWNVNETTVIQVKKFKPIYVQSFILNLYDASMLYNCDYMFSKFIKKNTVYMYFSSFYAVLEMCE